MLLAIIWAVIVGAIIGIVARLIMPGRQNISMLMTVVVGIVAALIGTAIARALHVADTSGFDWIEHGLQVLLAIIGVSIVAGSRRSVH